MTFVCLWIPDWSTDAASIAESGDASRRPYPHPPALDRLTESLLRIVPRVKVGAGLIWADARGLPERTVAERLCAACAACAAGADAPEKVETQKVESRQRHRQHRPQNGGDAAGRGDACVALGSDTVPPPPVVRAGVARTPVVAEVAARHGSERVTIVPPGGDGAFLAPFPIAVLRDVADVDPGLLALLAGLGLERCGDLAALGREEVEVRCGAEGVQLWRLARAEDRRRPFGAFPRTLPRASCAWTDYVLRKADRLLFVIHQLVAQVCEALQAKGEGARELALQFALADRTVVDHAVRAAHPTADRATWLRLIRTDLERLRFADAVTGITVRVAAAAPTPDCQGDIFDRGFATARATEQAVAQLLDACGPDAVALTVTKHPLLERRMDWQKIRDPGSGIGGLEPTARPATAHGGWPRTDPGPRIPDPALTVQLLAVPRSVRVVTTTRRDHDIPIRYLDGDIAVDVLTAVGPDLVDGGSWERAPYTRDYFHCVTNEGRLVLLCRSGTEWFLHGWWD